MQRTVRVYGLCRLGIQEVGVWLRVARALAHARARSCLPWPHHQSVFGIGMRKV